MEDTIQTPLIDQAKVQMTDKEKQIKELEQ
jgi:hypothetical protein